MTADILIADDEEPALAELQALLRADDRIGDIHTARSGADALRILARTAVDIAFLDIHMPGLDGMDLARALTQFQHHTTVVFVTADDSLAVDAFDVAAVDYVLKPVRPARLRQAVDRALGADGAVADAALAGRALTDRSLADRALTDDLETIAATTGSRTVLVHRRDVRWVQAQGDYSRLWTDREGHLVRVPLSTLEERWQAAGFVRVHRSYLVHSSAVTGLRLAGSAPAVILAEVELPISRRMLPHVRERLLQG